MDYSPDDPQPCPGSCVKLSARALTVLKALVSSGKVQAQLPSTMTKAQQDMLAKLKGLQGDDFIKQYHSDQESAHKDAVDLFKRYGDGGDNAELKAWASSTRPALEHHLQMAKDLNQ